MGRYNTGAFRTEIQQVIRLFSAKRGTELDQLLYGLNLRIPDPAERDTRPAKVDLFVRQYEAAKQKGEVHPRVMFRLGGYHAARGLMRDFGGSTLGNYLSQFALTEGTTMINLAIKNCRGTSPSDFPRPCTWEEENA